MKLISVTPKKALKPFLKQKPLRSEIEIFKANLITLLDKINIIDQRPKDESEEHLKNDLRDFLRDTYYRETNAINTKDKKDLVIHLGKTTTTEVGVIVEAKRPNNVGEMISSNNPNRKALHELILYYLNERENGNNQLKQLIITNVNQWYLIDANFFDKYIYRNSQIRKLYFTKKNDKKDNPWFYEEIAKIIRTLGIEIPCVFFDIQEYDKFLRNNSKEDDKELSALFKILSPQHLLKIASPNDNNSLDERFYKELLHIIGLEEAKELGKTIIRRKKENRESASLIELTIDALETEDVLHRLPDAAWYGVSRIDRIFNVAVELCITWINRVLFLKLLEGQLIAYHQGDKNYKFLTVDFVNDFDELFKLFHKVLAINTLDRNESVKNKYRRVPYLNSSLFEISDLEDQTIKINALDNNGHLSLIGDTILKSIKKSTDKLLTLEYFFMFLDAYDFASEGTDDIQEDNKTIINASVLGKVFEKINGYRDGSIFTPAFITMYMCKEIVRLAVIDKFNEALTENGSKPFDKFDDLRNYTLRLFKTEDILKANSIVNSLHICDPAVGSGHFLVSALNEIISIKSELGILADKDGNCITQYELEIVNDELIITNPRNKDSIIEYKLYDGRPSKEMQHLQKTLFHEKQNIIENCLFGVDLNTNSVKICRLRLWIELLKNAYYKEETKFIELETLPNIDINIKPGNSLVSRFELDADVSKALKSIKYSVKAYRGFVNDYKNEKSREVKRGLQKIIDSIKADFRTEISKNDPKHTKLNKLSGDLFNLLNQGQIFELSAKEQKIKKEKQQKLEVEISKISKEIDEIKNNAIYKNAFEWRFEFPEILNNNGDFEGFDVIIGNPPYIQLQKLDEQVKNALQHQKFETFAKTGDIYQIFYEQGFKLLKPCGRLAFITSNKWMRTDYGAVTRKFLSERSRVNLVIDFGMKQLFESATTYTNILMAEKDKPSDRIKMCRVEDEFEGDTLLEDYVDFATVEIDNPGEKTWIAYDKNEYALIRKIIDQGKPLNNWDIQINRGILTGFNEAFIIDSKTRDELVAEDSKSAEILKPILRGEDIKAYVPKWAGLWLITTHNGIKNSGIKRIDVAKDYPAVYNWLSKFQSQLEKRSDKGDHWTNLRNCAYLEEFNKPKIVYPNMTKFLPFVYDKHQFFTNQKCFIITGKLLAYLTVFFNSKIFRFAFKEFFPELLGDTRELSKIFFERVSVLEVNEETNNEFELIINNITTLKKKGLSSEAIEQNTELKLAQLYSLSESEIAFIESSENAGVTTFPVISALSESVS